MKLSKTEPNELHAAVRLFGPAIRQKATELMENSGAKPNTIAYALSRQGAVTWACCSSMLADERVRIRVAVAIGIHMLGVKLWDDLIDNDTGFPPGDLSCGAYLIQWSTSELVMLSSDDRISFALEKYWGPIWKAVTSETIKKPKDLQEWVKLAKIKAGSLLVSYFIIAVCTTKDSVITTDSVQSIGMALGIILMVRDDLRDRVEKNETQGNLAYMLECETINKSVVFSLVEGLRDQACEALQGFKAESSLVPVVLNVCEDVFFRLNSILTCRGAGPCH